MIGDLALRWAERGLVPEPLLRAGIRHLLATRLADEARLDRTAALAAAMAEGPVALVPAKANEQHYEVPAEFFQLVLGKNLKYSSAYWPDDCRSLDEAEAAMLDLTCQRAQLADGQRVLELGCGWGSLSLWMARRYPNSRFVAVSNSASQRAFIQARAPGNLEVLTADMNDFAADGTFERVVSVEMFEHLRNWKEMLQRIRGWLVPGGKLFVHVFCHRRFAYPFETDGAANWMGRHFFTGGVMPSFDLLARIPAPLILERQHEVNGLHYARTAESWAERLAARRAEALPVLASTYGVADAGRWYQRWRLFFLACAELFAYRGGTEWLVGHYRLRAP